MVASKVVQFIYGAYKIQMNVNQCWSQLLGGQCGIRVEGGQMCPTGQIIRCTGMDRTLLIIPKHEF